ncbi:LPXTG cell wall anchor domain-containing protein [Streptococcus hyointestinalis]|uniref:LPXTG cell wall anchor domain-containing protein n=1 Tax=Streptococcus hyointestinalis TaxID=1337 RepID=UPI003CFF2CE7
MQDDYIFTGSKNEVTSATTWTETSHTYGAETLSDTGEDNSVSVVAMGAGIILTSLGLAAKRRRKEN